MIFICNVSWWRWVEKEGAEERGEEKGGEGGGGLVGGWRAEGGERMECMWGLFSHGTGDLPVSVAVDAKLVGRRAGVLHGKSVVCVCS